MDLQLSSLLETFDWRRGAQGEDDGDYTVAFIAKLCDATTRVTHLTPLRESKSTTSHPLGRVSQGGERMVDERNHL
jgi:hypothetical protein